MHDYDDNHEITTSKKTLLGIEQQVSCKGILTLDEMAAIIETVNNKVLKFRENYTSPRAIHSEEIRFIDDLLDDAVINRLLSYSEYKSGNA